MSDIIKKTATLQGAAINDSDLALINKHSIRALTADDVYVFKAVMCDNEIDREYEVFPVASLEKLAALFVGKTVIANHQWRSEAQMARIYKTEVVTENIQATHGENKAKLMAYCYTLRTDSNKDLIAEIDAGIKKEVSVGCRCEQAVCSICGTDNRKRYCEHFPGRTYDNQKCHFKLLDPTDAYELSFVAVPAQPGAGITKAYGNKPYELESDKEDPAKEPEESQTNKSLAIQLSMLDSFLHIENNSYLLEESK